MISTPHPVSILPSTQSSGGAIREFANSLRYGKVDFQDPKQQASLASALDSIQDQVNTITKALRKDLPLADPLQVTDSSGALVAAFGTMIGPDNQAHAGIWVASGALWLGSSGPSGTPVLPSPGWSLPTGTISRATFDESTVTLPELAQRLAALVEDLLASGILHT